MNRSSRGRIDNARSCPAICFGIIPPAGIGTKNAAPDDHFIAGPDCRVFVPDRGTAGHPLQGEGSFSVGLKRDAVGQLELCRGVVVAEVVVVVTERENLYPQVSVRIILWRVDGPRIDEPAVAIVIRATPAPRPPLTEAPSDARTRINGVAAICPRSLERTKWGA
jgi:hypothetical protein